MTLSTGANTQTRTHAEAEKLAAVALGVHGYTQPYETQLVRIHFIQIAALLREWSDIYCSTCHKTGTVVDVDYSRDDASFSTSDCACKTFKRVNEGVEVAIQMSGIPVKYQGARLDKWSNPGQTIQQVSLNERSANVVRSYSSKIKTMREKGYGLFLCGPNGVGKTYLSCAIAVEAIRSGQGVRFYTMSKIVRTVVDGWYDEEVKAVVRDIETTPFLVIDDLDKTYQTKTGLEISVLDNLFRERLQNNRPMIVTSNKPLDKLHETHGKSVASMFSEHCAQCVFVGDDYRRGIAGGITQDILQS